MSNSTAGIGIVCLGLIFLIAGIVLVISDSGRYRKYDGVLNGVIVGHKWIHQSETRYPVAIVDYYVNGNRYTVKQKYRAVIYNNVKHAQHNWEIDSDYRLHCYSDRKCEVIVDPITDWFPVGSQMEVHYVRSNPGKAYCGSLGSVALLGKFFLPVGAFIVVFGVLLMTLLR